MLYNRETHECICTYITSQIILSFYVKYSDAIRPPTSRFWVNIALFWMLSLMHTASSGKTVYASMCHLGLCVSVYVFLCVSILIQIAYAFVCFSVSLQLTQTCIWVSDSVCVSVCMTVLLCSLAGFPLQHPLATSPPSPINREAVI